MSDFLLVLLAFALVFLPPILNDLWNEYQIRRDKREEIKKQLLDYLQENIDDLEKLVEERRADSQEEGLYEFFQAAREYVKSSK